MKSIIFTILFALASTSVYAEQPFTVFTIDKRLQTKGAEPYTLLTSHYWFDRVNGKYDSSRHSVKRTKKYFPRNAQGPVIVDIEVWHLTPETRDDIYGKMLSVSNTVRAIAPRKQVGLYSMLPVRNYWTPRKFKPTDPEYQKWTANNQGNIKKIGPLFDFLAPSVYTFYEKDTMETWSLYANANLEEGVVADKPIYAFVWPNYTGTKNPIPDKLWRQQLRYLRDHKHCNGVFIFSSVAAKHDWQTAVAEELLNHKSKTK